MKGKRFTEEQIIRVLKAVEDGGKTVEDVCREHGVSNGSFYRWKAKYGGMDIAEARRLKRNRFRNVFLRPFPGAMLASWRISYASTTTIIGSRRATPTGSDTTAGPGAFCCRMAGQR